MELSETQIKDIAQEIAEVILKGIDADATYLVCNEHVTSYLTKRLVARLPVNFVHDKGHLTLVPPRDLGIYLLNDAGNALVHNSMDTGFASNMVEQGAGETKFGADISVGDIVASAYMDVLLRLRAQEAEA